MSNKRLDSLEKIAESLVWLRGPLVSALVNCLDGQELAGGLDRAPGCAYVLRRAIIRALSRDSQKLSMIQGPVLDSLLDRFQQADHRTVRAYAYILREIASLQIPASDRHRIISVLMNSRFIRVRESGYKAVRQGDDDPALNPSIEVVWRRFGDLKCAILIVDTMPLSFLLAEFDDLDSALVGLLPRARLYIRVAVQSPMLLKRLQIDDEIAWTYVKVKLRHPPLTSKEALALFWRNDLHPELALLLWCFGQMGLWGVLIELASKMDYFESHEYAKRKSKIPS